MSRIIVLTLICCIWSGFCYGADGSINLENVQPDDVSRFGPGLTSELNRGDLAFYAPFDNTNLSDVEKVMIVGGSYAGSRIRPWHKEVVMQCRTYYTKHHSVPSALTPDVLAETLRLDKDEAEALTFFRNPFSSDWVRCSQSTPSPGDIYCRPLSSEETRHVAQQEDVLAMVLRGESPHGGGKAQLDGDVWYVRVYGQDGRVIFAGLDYAWLVDR